MFDTYAELLRALTEWLTQRFPKTADDTDFVYRQAIRAKALDASRGLLPASAISNVGIYGSGQGYESLLLRMRAHPLPEVRDYAQLMLDELMKVIPSFLRRVEVAERGGAWTDYLARTRAATRDLVALDLARRRGRRAGRVGAPGRLRPRGRASRARGHRLRDFGDGATPRSRAAWARSTSSSAPTSSRPTSARASTAGTGRAARSSAPTTASSW